MSRIEQLAINVLNQQELQLAERLSFLLDDDEYDRSSLIEEMIPIYWERVGDIEQTLSPDNIYRPLYYIHQRSSERNFSSLTRAYMMFISSHLEGCLKNLKKIPSQGRMPSETFGTLVRQLKEASVLSEELANQLWKFNEVVNIASKHFDTYMPTRRLNERTFSVMETVYALVLMRKFSIQLFTLMKAKGVALPHGWPEFKNEWLSWSRQINGSLEQQ